MNGLRALMIALALISLGASRSHSEEFKIGYIYPTALGDVGWSHQLDLGRQAVEKALPGKTKSVIVAKVPEGPDAPRVMNQMVADGAKMLMLGSFGYMNDGLKVARQHPELTFIQASGYKQLPNYGTFLLRNYEGAYVAGMGAGMVTKSNTLGVVAAYAIPEVIGILDAFALGARTTKPDMKVKVVWLNTWNDPPKSQDAARALIATNCDVIFSLYQEGPPVLIVAEENGVYSVNLYSDMKKYAPKHLLVSVEMNFAPYMIESTKAAMAGTFKGEGYWGGMAVGGVKMDSWSDDLSREQRAKLDQAVDAIRSGKLHPFTGPIKDQDGKERLKTGETMSDRALLGIDWLVEGVETRIPSSKQ